QQAVSDAELLAKSGALVTFGIRPASPKTEYGYIQQGEAIALSNGAGYQVRRFVEKPDAEKAAALLADGSYFWNSGIFMFRASSFLEELSVHAPEMLAACRNALTSAQKEKDFHWLDEAAFSQSPSDSIDYAVMEKTRNAALVPVDFGWSDV